MSVAQTTTVPPLMATTAKLLRLINQKPNVNKKKSSSSAAQSTSHQVNSASSNLEPTIKSERLATTTSNNNPSNHRSENAEAKLDKIVGAQSVASGGHLARDFKTEIVWRNIVLFIILHTCVPLSLYTIWSEQPWRTFAYAMFLVYFSGLGVTGGAHRLWSHKSYKASLPVEILLVILQTCAGQNSVFTWVRDHRVHHKFAETNADPHNIKRGFFFAHMGWLCCKKHPEVAERGQSIDMSDLATNRIVMFQHKHFWWMAIVFTVLVPTMIPVLLWQERFWTSFLLSFMLRYTITLHGTWLVNSAAHYYGHRPYNKRIEARESPYVIALGFGEGFHNYHHTFPYDYSTSEYGKYFNMTTTFIDAMAAIGWVHDRRSASAELIAQRCQRTGAHAEAQRRQCGQKNTNQNHHQINDTSSLKCEETLDTVLQDMPYISGLTSMKYSM